MQRRIHFIIALIAASIGFASSPAAATTYYISTGGSDSNSGTSTSAPWLHIPGGAGCTANCAAHTPVAGDQFIFRGGEVWHVSRGSNMGYTAFTWSGSATGCDVRNGKTSTCIYIGVDKTWYTGGSWTRPIIDWDNPPSTSAVASCAYYDNSGSGAYIFNISGSYVTIDNFELRGWCQGDYSGVSSNFAKLYGTYDTVENIYQHGWTHTATCTAGNYCEDDSLVYGSSTNVDHHSYIYNNTLNGSDSSPGQGSLCKYECAYVVNNTARYVSQGIVGVDTIQFSGNWIDNVENPWDGQSHGNVDEMTAIPAGNIYVFNNLLSNSRLEVGYWIGARGGATLYFYNNVIYGVSQSTGNCLLISGAGDSGNTYNFYNNTLVSPCGVRYTTNNADFVCPRGNGYWTNSIAIGYGSFPQNIDAACAGLMPLTYTTNYVMSTSEAETYGFTAANKFKPTASDSNTAAAGTNLNSCSVTASLCQDASGNPWFGSAYVNRPASGNWDIGSYQFGASSSSQPAPPTNLNASVQ